MTGEQLIVFGVLAATLVLFVWNRWRYDLVALAALLACALTGVVPAEEVFAGLGHPAVISVAAVLVLSRGLLNAGVVDSVARRLMQVGERPWAQVAALTGIVALSSGFMNNVGALALFMPVAIWMSRQSGRSPSYLLMPLAFGSLLGGTLTLIGTPPNLIIAGYRAEAGEAPFGMFAFLPVGGAVTVAGVLFITLLGWRLVPRRQEQEGNGDLIRGDYAVTGLAEHLDGALPGCATEILAMQQERRAAVRLAGRRNVHVGHLHRLALGLETIVLERMRIAEAFQLRAIAGPAFGQYWQAQG